MDEEAIATLVQLMRLMQPLAKTHMQKLFNNICMHSQSRPAALGMFMSLLRAAAPQPGPDDPMASSGGSQAPAAMAGASSLADTLAVAGPRSAARDAAAAAAARGDARIPPQVSRRVLELVTWLARCQPAKVVQALISLGVPMPGSTPLARTPLGAGSGPGVGGIGSGSPASGAMRYRKGKRKIEETEDKRVVPAGVRGGGSSAGAAGGEQVAVEVLLDLLGRPLCQRSKLPGAGAAPARGGAGRRQDDAARGCQAGGRGGGCQGRQGQG